MFPGTHRQQALSPYPEAALYLDQATGAQHPYPPGASRIGLLPLATSLHFLCLLTLHFPKQDIKGRETEGFRGFAASAPGKTRHSSPSEIASLGEPVGHRSPPSTAKQKIEFVSPFPRPPFLPLALSAPPLEGLPCLVHSWGLGPGGLHAALYQGPGQGSLSLQPGREERSLKLFMSPLIRQSHFMKPSHNLSFPAIFRFPGHSLALAGMYCVLLA